MRSRVLSDSGFSSDSTETCTASGNSILEEIQSLEQKINRIRMSKETFLEKCSRAYENVENVTRNFCLVAQAREQELKSLLQEIANSKILEWNRQLNVCFEAEFSLRNMDSGFIGVVGDVISTAHRFSEKIGFIDAGDVRFDVDSVENVFDDFGGFRLQRSSENPKPRFVLDNFNIPWGVCSDATGRILVADSGNNRVQVFNEFGDFLFRFGEFGRGPGEFANPTGIAVDNSLRIFVSDKHNHRIQVFTFTGRFLLAFGEKGTNPGQFLHPWDVAVNENGEIAVSDTRNHRIQLFGPHGGFISQFDFSISPTFVFSPRGVAFKPDGTLIVTDCHHHCVFLIDKGLTIIRQFKTGSFFKPQGVACNSQGMIAFTDGRNNVQIFDECGNLYRMFNALGNKRRRFGGIQGICFLPDGGIAVSDICNKIHVF